MTGLDWVLPVAGGISVLAGAILAISKGMKWVRATLRKAEAFFDDWSGEAARPGHDRVPGVLERIAVMEQRLKRVEAEVKPNGGGSLRDAVDRIDGVVSNPDS